MFYFLWKKSASSRESKQAVTNRFKNHYGKCH